MTGVVIDLAITAMLGMSRYLISGAGNWVFHPPDYSSVLMWPIGSSSNVSSCCVLDKIPPWQCNILKSASEGRNSLCVSLILCVYVCVFNEEINNFKRGHSGLCEANGSTDTCVLLHCWKVTYAFIHRPSHFPFIMCRCCYKPWDPWQTTNSFQHAMENIRVWACITHCWI